MITPPRRSSSLSEPSHRIQTSRLFPWRFPPSPFEFDDIGDDIGGLEAATIYQYRVRARDSNDDIISNWSSPEGTGVAGKTLSFEPTFDAESQLTLDEEGREGFCLVQRIEPARLMLSGTQVRITLRGSSVSGASIDRIYISNLLGG